MKISTERLKQIIAEELTVGFAPLEGGENPEGSRDPDGRMAKQNLWKMAEYAKELYNLIGDEEDLEPWVEEKIAIASFMMDSVGHYMQYEKHRGHEEEENEEDHFELDLDDYDEDEGEDEYEDDEEI